MIFLLFGHAIFFWLAFLVLIALDIFFLEIDQGWLCSVGLALFIGVVLWQGETSLFSWIVANPLYMIGGIIGYIATGIPYGWKVEWPLYLRKKGVEWQEKRRDWLRSRGVEDATLDTPVPVELIDERPDRYSDNNWRFASKNKGKIISLMSWWPIAMFRSLTREPFLIAYNLLAEKLQASADRQAQKIGLLDDMASAKAHREENDRVREEERTKRDREIRS